MTNFLFPLAFAFAAVLPVIVLMYLLRLKRQKVVISSILLWRKSIQDLQANAPFQKLRNNLLLWLQLLIAAFLVFSLARPMMNLATLKGRSIVALIDTSASMKALEGDKARIDKAKDALQTMIRDMSRGDEMMIVAFDREAHVVQTFTDDQSRLLAAVSSIQARDNGSYIRDALLLSRTASEARAVPVTTAKPGEQAKGASNVEVVVLSDGAIADLDKTPESLPPVRYVPIGMTGDNTAIVSLDLRETFERQSDRQIFATVQNFGSVKKTGIVECHLNGSLIDAKEFSLEPGKNAAVIFADMKNRTGKIELRLRDPDKLDIDNEAYGVLQPVEPAKVLLVGTKDPFLEKLLASNPNLKLFLTTPERYNPAEKYDAVVFDNFTPKQLPPGSYLMFNALPPLEGFGTVGEALASPSIIDWNRVHPLTRYVNFESIQILQAMHVKTPSWAQTLAEGELSPLIFAVERDQRQVVCVAFDLFQSDWPLRVSFPVFVSNAINWLTRSSGMGKAFAYASGATIPFSADQAPQEYTITAPDKSDRKLRVEPGQTSYFSTTDQVGVYEVKSGKESRAFSVNLDSSAESNLGVKETLSLNDREVKGNPSVLKQNREVWTWFALAALAVLALEWMIYCRRAWI